MKILIGMTRSDTTLSGSYRHICQIGERFESEGVEVIYTVGGNGVACQKLREKGFKVISLKYLKRDLNPIADFISQCQLIAIILKEKPQLCSWHTAKIGALGRIASFLTRRDAFYVPHGVPFVNTPENSGYKFYERLEKALAVLPAKIIGVCEFDFKEYVRIGVKKNRLMMIPNGMQVSLDHINDEKIPYQTPIKFITAARFEQQKDYHTLAFACQALYKEKIRFELHIYGDGPNEKEVKALFSGIASEHIFFHGTVDNFSKELISSDVYILSSHWEGLPRSIIEAMACKKAVIASDVGGVDELVKEDSTGYLIKHRDSAGFMSAMKTYIDHPEKIIQHGESAHKIYLEQYTLKKMLDTYSETYFKNRRKPIEGQLIHED